jgi:preprotein translocase subunit SecA
MLAKVEKFFSKLMGGTSTERELKKIDPIVEEVNRIAEEYEKLTDDELKAKTNEFRYRLKIGETVDDLLPEAFAAVKDTCRRLIGKSWLVRGQEIVWNMIPYDVQIYGGVVLHQGRIAEMATGEGKTLVATMPLYLNALEGKGAHLITVNDYLAQRDCEWMGEIFKFLGLTVSAIFGGQEPEERKRAYSTDISYGTNNEFGFDYLRDNMATDIWSVVQRPLFYAIVDEVDSVLIDEARTPLIISGSVGAPRNVYNELKPIVENLYKRQQELVKQLINEGKELLEKDEEQAGMMILRALRGDPKNKELLELLTSEFWVKKLIERIQGQFEIDKKMAVVDQELYYTIDEKSHVVDITEKGRIFLSGGRDLDVAYKIQLLDKLDAAVTHLGEIKHAGRFFMQNPVSGKCNGFTPEGRLALVNISEQVSEQTTQALDELASRLHNLAEQPDASSVKKVDRSSLLRGYYLPAKKMEGVINGLSESGRASLLKDGMSAVQEMVSAYEQLLALLVEQADVDSAPAVTRQQQERRKVLQNTFFVTDKQVGCPVGLTEQGRLALLVVHYGGNPLTVPTIFQLDAMLHAEDQDEKLLDYFEFSDDGSILKHISEKGRIALLGGDPDLYVLPDRGIVEERDRQIQLLLDRTLNQTTYDYAARVQAVERLETDIQDISLAIGNSGTPSEASAFYNLNDSDSSFAQFRLTAKGRAFYTDFAEQTQQIVEQLDKDMRQFLVDPEKVFAVREERYIGLHEVELDRLLGASFKETEETIAQWQQTRSAAAETSSVALREELDQYLGSSTQEGVSLSRRFEEIQRIAHIFENLFKFISRNDVSDAEKRRLLRRYFEFSETVKGSVAADASLGLAGLSAAGMERMAGQTIARLQIYDRLMAMQAENPADMEAILEFGENGFPVGLKKAARSLLMDGLPFFSFNEGLKKFREEMLFLSTKKVQTGQELQGLLPKEKAQLRGKHYLFDEREMNELLSALHHPGSVMTTEEIEHWFRQHFVRQPRQIMENRRDRLWRNYSLVEERIQNISQLLRAYTLYHRDIEYVVKTPEENELRRVGGSRGQKAVMIVDQFTGRLMPGRRFSDGLHEALEAKEGVQVQAESQTLATITLQNFFRLYRKLAGMTGTAETEAQEFFSTYKLEVVVVPTNREVIRGDFNDVIFRTRREKFNAVIDEALAMHEQGRPVLIGSISVDVSQHLSNLFAARGIPMANWLQKGDVSRELESGRFHTVLNAKYHKSEAEIVTKAGLPGAITIATNMAGRGTDIKLAEGIANKGGLHIIGSEKHEARRIDRQLRGRAGRQGDPGSSRFYLSLEDDLMRLFGSDRITSIMSSLGSMEEGERIEHPLITKSIERAQKKVEERNFEIRKNLLEYDDVLNDQRKIIYRRRQNLLGFAQPEDLIESKLKKHITDETDRSTWKLADLLQDLQEVFGQTPPFEVDRLEQLKMEEVKEELLEWVTEQIGRRQRYQQMQERHRIFGYTPVETVLDHLVRLKIRLHNGGAADTSKWNIEAIRFELDRLFGSAPDWLEANPEGLGTAADVERRILEWAHRHYQQKCEENAEAFSRILFGALTMPQLLDIFVIGLVNMYLPANAGSVNWRTEEFLHDLERIFESHPQLGHNEMRSIRIEKIIEIVRDWLKGLRLGEDQRERLMHRIFGFFTSLQFADSVIAYLFYEKDDDLGDLSAVDKAFFAQVFGSELLPANNKEQETYRMQARRQTRKAYLDLLAEHQQAYDVVMLGSASNEEIIEAAIHALVQQVLKQYPDAASAQKHFSELLDNVLLSRPDINVPEQRDPQAVASFTEDVVAWGLTFYKTYTDRVGLLQQEELSSEIVSDSVLAMIDDTIYTMIGNTLDKDESLDSNQISRLEGECRLVFRQSPRLYDGSTESMDPNQVMEQLSEWAKNLYHQRIKELGRERVTRLERYFVLEKMDETWRQHLNGIDELREGIGLRGYGQKDPLLEYKREAFTLFGRTIDTINRETVSTLFKVFDVGGEMEDQQMRRIEPQSFTTSHSQVELFKQVMSGKSEAAPPSSPVQQSAAQAVRRQPVVKAKNVGRNDPCPCGSGKKYKNCCGRDL